MLFIVNDISANHEVIGYLSNGSRTDAASVEIDELALYDYILNQSQTLSHYMAGRSVSSPTPPPTPIPTPTPTPTSSSCAPLGGPSPSNWQCVGSVWVAPNSSLVGSALNLSLFHLIYCAMISCSQHWC